MGMDLNNEDKDVDPSIAELLDLYFILQPVDRIFHIPKGYAQGSNLALKVILRQPKKILRYLKGGLWYPKRWIF